MKAYEKASDTSPSFWSFHLFFFLVWISGHHSIASAAGVDFFDTCSVQSRYLPAMVFSCVVCVAGCQHRIRLHDATRRCLYGRDLHPLVGDFLTFGDRIRSNQQYLTTRLGGFPIGECAGHDRLVAGVSMVWKSYGLFDCMFFGSVVSKCLACVENLRYPPLR